MKLIDNILDSESTILHLLLSPVYFVVWIAWSLLSWIALMIVMIFSICTGAIFKGTKGKDPYDLHPEPWGEDGPN